MLQKFTQAVFDVNISSESKQGILLTSAISKSGTVVTLH